MTSQSAPRRQFVARTAAAAAVAVVAPYVRGAHAAGKLSLGFWDHWVPSGNEATRKLVDEWAKRERVEVQLDFITSQGRKLLLTTAAEAQARSGHDVLSFGTYLPAEYADRLEPVDDIVQPLIALNGPVNAATEYLGRIKGHWVATPATAGNQIKGPCSRIDLLKQHAGIDIQALYPAGQPPQAEAWTLDAFLKAAEACHKAGFPFGIGLGVTADSTDSVGAIFHSFGAALVDASGTITVKSDPVRQALDYLKRLGQFLPPDVPAWDDSSNNKWLVSGKGAMIMNPPSAWAVAVRDAPEVAAQLWTHGMPAGPKGRFAPFNGLFYGIWQFSRNKAAAKSLLTHLSQPDSIRQLVEGSQGYDIPAFASMTELGIWAAAGPPKGTLYHYPNPYQHQTISIAASPAPHKIAVQIYVQGVMCKMAVRHLQGEAMERTLAWAEREVEGFMRS
jgi:ABC-type glycerol-3-phosphate transport system substrate-binding protein